MRYSRLALIFLAVYVTFVGGTGYYNSLLPVRILHHAVVTLLLALWAVSRLRRGQGLPHTPLNLPIYAMAVVWPVSAAASLDPRMALENLWLPLLHILIFFVMVDLLQRGRQRLLMEILFFVATLVVLISGLEIAAWYFGFGITSDTRIGWIDVIGPGAWIPLSPVRLWWAMGVSTWLAAYTAPAAVIAGVWSLTARRRDHRVVLRVLAGLLLAVLILTFSRGGIVSIVVSVGVLFILRLRSAPGIRRYISGRVWLAMLVLGGILAAGLLGVLLLSQMAGRASGDVKRVDLWNSAIQMTLDHPVLGVGPGLFGRALREYRNPANVDDRLASAHNLYLNVSAETGLVGIIVLVWLAAAYARAWWNTWKSATPAHRFRLEAALAALLGLGVQSLFDVFATTPVILPVLLLIAYGMTEARSPLDIPVRTSPRWSLATALALVVAFGAAFVQLDRARLYFQQSLKGGENGLASAQSAAALDPMLRLYRLQVDYLSAKQLLSDCAADVAPAIAGYEDAVHVEPTWDTGWINLASLTARQGKLVAALDYLDRARRIKNANSAALNWARLAEQANAAAPEDILDAYALALAYDPNLPLSEFWSQTVLRRQAVARFVDKLPLDLQYRVLAATDPQAAETLVPVNPSTAAEWWVVGEHALNAAHHPNEAITSFTEAIHRDVTNGDYYVSRARAEVTTDPAAARRDLDIAKLLGARFEYPNAVRLKLAATPEEAFTLRASALPPRVIEQNFEGVLYSGRVANFEVFVDMRRPGPGTAAMQPWYDIAADYLAAGKTDQAAGVYRAILDYAPDESLACRQLKALELDRKEAPCSC